ncbi:putative F-box/kelch-repeat protein At3g17540 [Rhododendron vialii]|uniref:putative F-box/kelch-repeat protein At3g17540 n=1 Tax=Rhododendron vialii TaxID=182163 RepID=UPI00265E5533|nr:putative F-box/kelch-repeat protein At3g17540 [Rhododendron vialii]XP_058215101.1 putative F-box/kelch-repeat protein At3g17540 [Rhododendron vialii]XP_058215102.1 putative F-box/kelch-repeat protein At3g17540 [Rhododendron vialii]XP_058215103.1 putative F-box/kelch-repeat protein At3g17540 [Rhododendron vialii]
MTAGAVLNGRAGRKNYKLVPCSKKKKMSGESSLPDELIFDILVCLPAYVLYKSTRYVCWQWYEIIHDPLFCKEQLLRSSSSLLMQYSYTPHTGEFAEFGEMSATAIEINFMFPNRVLSTCNGLVLFCNPHDPSTLHVANPLTKQTVTVPPFKCHPDGSCISFACAYSKMEYKVLCTYGPDGGKHNCMMLTLGKDHAWKPIKSCLIEVGVWSEIVHYL